jgi:hypothetical protein
VPVKVATEEGVSESVELDPPVFTWTPSFVSPKNLDPPLLHFLFFITSNIGEFLAWTDPPRTEPGPGGGVQSDKLHCMIKIL